MGDHASTSVSSSIPSIGSYIAAKRFQRDYDNTHVKINMDKALLLDGLIACVTVDGRSFEWVESRGLRLLIGPILKAIEEQHGNTIVINRKSIEEEVSQEALRIRNSIKKEISGLLVSLKIDKATYMGHHIVGLNLHFLRDGRLVVSNLCVHKFDEEYTIEALERVILETCHLYDINLRQIYSVVIDNSCNMAKRVKFDCDEFEDDTDTDCDERSTTSDADTGIYGHAEIDQLYLQTIAEGVGVRSQGCAAYTLQLAVYEALTSTPFLQVLNKARNLCTALRSPVAAAILKDIHRQRPSSDKMDIATTSWYSTLTMIESLLPLQEVVEAVFTNPELSEQRQYLLLTADEWSSLRDITAALQPAKIATYKFQTEQLFVGDFMATWLTCKLETESISTPLAISIHAAMEEQEKKLLCLPHFVAAIALDPRFQILLSNENKQLAEDHLLKLWVHLNDFNKSKPSNIDGSSSESENMVYNSVERLLRELDATTNIGRQNNLVNIRKLIQDFARHPRLPTDSDILIFWESRREYDPQLYRLARVVLCYPVTQITAEYTHRQLPFVVSLSDRRLTPSIKQNIMAVRWKRMYS